MKPAFSSIALTLFPDMFPGPLGHSLAGKALEKGIWSLQAIDIRSFATDKHRTVDDSPYGGGTGMVMKPDVVDSALEHAKSLLSGARLAYTTPRGVPFTQRLAETLKQQPLIVLCGRFEGVDQRVIEHHNMLEVSLGDFVLSGGEIAALAMLDAIVRLLPGVIGKREALTEESFSLQARSEAEGEPALSNAPCESQQVFAGAKENFAGLLEYPHYTRPPSWKGLGVPDVLLSGNHERINTWRLEQARTITAHRRPDLIQKKE